MTRADADAAFDDAYNGFRETWEALQAKTRANGTLEERLTEMREALARIEAELLAQRAELRALRQQS